MDRDQMFKLQADAVPARKKRFRRVSQTGKSGGLSPLAAKVVSRSLKSRHENPFAMPAIKSSGAATSSSTTSVNSRGVPTTKSSSTSSSNPFFRKSKFPSTTSVGERSHANIVDTGNPKQLDYSNPFSQDRVNVPSTAVTKAIPSDNSNPFARSQVSFNMKKPFQKSNPFSREQKSSSVPANQPSADPSQRASSSLDSVKSSSVPGADSSAQHMLSNPFHKTQSKMPSQNSNPFSRELKSSSVPANKPSTDFPERASSTVDSVSIRSSSVPSADSNTQYMLSNPFHKTQGKLSLPKLPSYAQVAAGRKPQLQQSSSSQDERRNQDQQRPIPLFAVENATTGPGAVPLFPHLSRDGNSSVQQFPLPRRSGFSTEGQNAGGGPGSGISTATALHLKGLPEDINNEAVLTNHFSKFGATSVRCNTAKMFATVSFKTHADAARAKQRGKFISPNHPQLKMFWHAQRTPPHQPRGPPPPLSATDPSPSVTDPSLLAVPSVTATQAFNSSGSPPKEQFSMMQGGEQPQPPRTAGEIYQSGTRVQSKVVLGQKATKGKRKLVSYDDDQEWRPSKEQEKEEHEQEKVDQSEMEGGASDGRGKVRQSVLRDLGLKLTGDEMDTIARHPSHSYYLRSLEIPEQQTSLPLFAPIVGSVAEVAVNSNSEARPVATTICPYALPTLSLPAPPTPKGQSASDFYEALNARDQEMRKGISREKSLDTDIIIGVCPDMCPEKERYRREETRRLSFFEVRQDSEPRNPKVDHKRAVKEYSGSAADKEEALPHDLRPLGVLQMTMDYLISVVMDAGQDRPYDWYDFLWNRTRGIRKDITIQRLISPESVQLVEKCARFHVLCAHHLCEEDVTTFDPKMNNENLNKCLLSLKEFYKDLRLSQGILCPNEGEFCCYDILLHLTDGNVLSMVQDYSPEVSKHPLVVFAVNAVLAYGSNNFIKFFKLVRSASYLNACLLHRYFTVVRVQGLRVMNRSHSMQRKPAAFPLSDLARMMAFKDASEAAEFCREFDLKLTESDVSFSRGKTTDIKLPNKPLPQKSTNLVLSLSSKSLGEVVNNGSLPPVYRHTPHCSFTATSSSPSTDYTDATHDEVPEAVAPEAPPYSQQDVQEAVDGIVEEELAQQNISVVAEALEEEEILEKEVASVVRVCVCECEVSDEVHRELVEVIRECVAEERGVRAAVCSDIMRDVCEEAVTHMIRQECTSSLLDAQLQLQLEMELMETETAAVVTGMLPVMVREEIKNAKAKRKRKLEFLGDRFYLNHTVRGYWNRWCEALEERHYIQNCAQAMPPCPPFLTLSEQLDKLLPPHRRKRLVRAGFNDVDVSVLEESRTAGERRHSALFSPLDLPVILRDQILMSRTPCPCPSPPPSIYWKLLLLAPPIYTLSPSAQDDLSWIYSKFQSPTPDSDMPTLQQLGSLPAFLISKSSLPLPPVLGMGSDATWADDGAGRELHMAVQWITNGLPMEGEERRQVVTGACAIAMFVVAPTSSVSPEDFITAQLDLLLSSMSMPSSKCGADVPLLVMYSSELEEERYFAFWCASRTALERTCQSRPVAEVFWLRMDLRDRGHTPEVLETELTRSLRVLCSSCPPQPSIIFTPITDYLERCLQKHFDRVVMSDSRQRAMANLPPQSPGALIKLFNSVLVHVADHVSRAELQSVQWPLPEFVGTSCNKLSARATTPIHWNSPGYLDSVRAFLVSLSLPGDYRDFPSVGKEWPELVAECLSYVSSLLRAHPAVGTASQTALLILSRVNSLLHQTGKYVLDETPPIPWDRVILVCIQEIIHALESDLCVARFYGEEESEVGVGYSAMVELFCASTETAINYNTVTPRSRYKRHRHVSDLMTPASPSLPSQQDQERKRLRLAESRQLVQSYEDQLKAWLVSSGPELATPTSHVVATPNSPPLATPTCHVMSSPHVIPQDCSEALSLSKKLDLFSKKISATKRQMVSDTSLLRSFCSEDTFHP